ncbi:MAG: DUF1294 domain-containing protein [Lachnospiraceae bacterium]|nr:DUF1294 domain-containing protein [Lachnospiraceae bacterium]
MTTLSTALLLYLLLLNLTGFLIMGIDKRRARRHMWRISEKTLFFTALLGGSVGTLAGMYAFRHKTRHWYFVIGMPLILILQAGIAVYFFF